MKLGLTFEDKESDILIDIAPSMTSPGKVSLSVRQSGRDLESIEMSTDLATNVALGLYYTALDAGRFEKFKDKFEKAKVVKLVYEDGTEETLTLSPKEE